MFVIRIIVQPELFLYFAEVIFCVNNNNKRLHCVDDIQQAQKFFDRNDALKTIRYLNDLFNDVFNFEVVSCDDGR